MSAVSSVVLKKPRSIRAIDARSNMGRFGRIPIDVITYCFRFGWPEDHARMKCTNRAIAIYVNRSDSVTPFVGHSVRMDGHLIKRLTALISFKPSAILFNGPPLQLPPAAQSLTAQFVPSLRSLEFHSAPPRSEPTPRSYEWVMALTSVTKLCLPQFRMDEYACLPETLTDLSLPALSLGETSFAAMFNDLMRYRPLQKLAMEVGIAPVCISDTLTSLDLGFSTCVGGWALTTRLPRLLHLRVTANHHSFVEEIARTFPTLHSLAIRIPKPAHRVTLLSLTTLSALVDLSLQFSHTRNATDAGILADLATWDVLHALARPLRRLHFDCISSADLPLNELPSLPNLIEFVLRKPPSTPRQRLAERHAIASSPQLRHRFPSLATDGVLLRGTRGQLPGLVAQFADIAIVTTLL